MCLAPTLKPTPVIEWLLTKNEKNLLSSIRTILIEKLSEPVRKTISRITPQFLETLLSNEKFDHKEFIDLKQVNIFLILMYMIFIIFFSTILVIMYILLSY